MLGHMKRFGITTALIAALATVLAGAAEAKRHRPTDAPPGSAVSQLAPNPIQVFNDYVAPPRAHASARAVVYYVAVGVDAPPLNDDDADGVPDYVERVGEAADSAIAYFERRGFARILTDAGGPDGRPDIYISRFAAGYFGVAFPAASSDNGAFVAVANGLDPSPTRSFGSLTGTVAHELFHLVQFSYFRATADPDLPGWALEGMAAAMERRVHPELEDIVSSLQLRRWFEAPQRSITVQSYGTQLLWRFLVELPFRKEYLRGVRDPEVVYYWTKEFPLLTGRPQDAWLATWSRAEAAVPHPLDPIQLAEAVTMLLKPRVPATS